MWFKLMSCFSTKEESASKTGRQIWIFGIDQETKKAFLVEVPQRDAATLLPIIQQRILPGNRLDMRQFFISKLNIYYLPYRNGSSERSVCSLRKLESCYRFGT